GPALEGVRAIWSRPLLSPVATGAGRWFDAVAALYGLRAEISYDGQAAVELEAAAAPGEHAPYPLALGQVPGQPFMVDLRPAGRAIAGDVRRGVSAGVVAARFHETLADAIARACGHAREAGAPALVALAGGCFVNRRLTERATERLEREGFEVL